MTDIIIAGDAASPAIILSRPEKLKKEGGA